MIENLRMNDRCGNVAENKGSASDNRVRSGNVAANKYSYPQNTEMLLKTQEVDGMS
jgi:hypothetical protein